MTTLHLNSEIDLEQIIHSMGKLDNQELEKVLGRLSMVLAQRKAPNVSAKEASLLQKINRSISPVSQQRHQFLSQKLDAEVLTVDEHIELTGLIDDAELADAERLDALVELSNLRKVSLEQLMLELNISAPEAQLVHG